MAESLLRLPQVLGACAISRTELYRRVGAGDFPPPIALGRRSVAWRSTQVQEWIAARLPKATKATEARHA